MVIQNSTYTSSQAQVENRWKLLTQLGFQEAEDAFHKWRASTEPSEQDVKDQIEKAYIEGTAYKPIPMRNHYDTLNYSNKFEKD